jgi:protein TonB
VEMITEMMAPPPPKPVPPPPPPPAQPPREALKARPAALPPPPQPTAIADTTPAPNAVTGVTTPPAPLAPITAPVAAGPPSPPAPAKVELPSSNADYLNNPSPPYPAISKRLNEQGKVIVRVLIGADGIPQKADVVQSSGFERLDQVALHTVMKWRFVPGKRGGVAEAMPVNIPLNFVLE